MAGTPPLKKTPDCLTILSVERSFPGPKKENILNVLTLSHRIARSFNRQVIFLRTSKNESIPTCFADFDKFMSFSQNSKNTKFV